MELKESFGCGQINKQLLLTQCLTRACQALKGLQIYVWNNSILTTTLGDGWEAKEFAQSYPARKWALSHDQLSLTSYFHKKLFMFVRVLLVCLLEDKFWNHCQKDSSGKSNSYLQTEFYISFLQIKTALKISSAIRMAIIKT